jgi:hypothetical protein
MQHPISFYKIEIIILRKTKEVIRKQNNSQKMLSNFKRRFKIMNSKFVKVLLTIVFLFSGIVLAQHDPLFDNFEDQNNTTNWSTRWEIFADDDVNTTSDPAVGDSVVYADGAAGTSYCGYLTGSFAGWGLGLVGWFDPSGEALGVDLSEFKGVSFYAMGNNQPVRVVIREVERYATFDFYNYIITPGDDWALYTIPFDSLYLMWEDETLPPFSPDDCQAIDFRLLSKDTYTEIFVDEINFIPKTISTIIEPTKNDAFPKNYVLTQNYPNPFNPQTTIEFDLVNNSFVTLKVFDMIGREVATLVNQYMKTGNYKFDFNAGAELPTGIYIYRLEADGIALTKKMILLK